MSIYDVDYSKLGPQTLPPDKRGTVIVRVVNVLLSPIQWVRDLWMGSYRTGSNAQPWIPATYAKYARVLYKQRVYESLIDGNTDIPTVQTSWMMVQVNFIGVFERVLYNGTTIVLEYGLNKYFGTIFRQPPNVSDIYMSAQEKPKNVFVVGGSEANSSVVFAGSSSGFVINSYSFGLYYNLIIYVPSSTYYALDPVPANCDKIIRNFADKYIFAGIIYQIIPY